MPAQGKWRFWIDRGGTFTDVVAVAPDGATSTHKLLSERPECGTDAAVQGIRDAMGLAGGEPIPAERIAHVKMGTTVATNALLEHKGERTLFVTTRGFGDILRIGYQNRPRIFDLHIVKPKQLYGRVLEVDERVGADGDVVVPLDIEGAEKELRTARADGFASVAIAFMHGHCYPAHERAVADAAQRAGFAQVSTSHETSPLVRLVSRGDTTVATAYLSPLLRRYVAHVAQELGGGERGPKLMFMRSDGGLTQAGFFRGKDAILSGPAGGVIGMAGTGLLAGHSRLIGFDMGGTSTDVSHYDGGYERSGEKIVAGVRIRAPMMDIHTVAAGGGSILRFDGMRYRVGPESAGAVPGPACYRRGGPLTLTDCNLLLGKLVSEHFPYVFGPGGDEPLDADIVRTKFAELAGEVSAATGRKASPEEVAEGFLRIAYENMANAIKKISVQRGHDATRHVLNCFGGAGGQHACRVADLLGIRVVIVHPYAGVLSAYGMGLAEIRAVREAQADRALEPGAAAELGPLLDRLAEEVRAEVAAQVEDGDDIRIVRTAQIRYTGTDTTLGVPFGEEKAMADAFEAMHRKRFGFSSSSRGKVVDHVIAEAIGNIGAEAAAPAASSAEAAEDLMFRLGSFYSDGQWQEAKLYDRARLPEGWSADGPATIIESGGTNVIESGWRASIHKGGMLEIVRAKPLERREVLGTDVDPIMLEVFNNLFMSIAEQMGVTLENTAYSVNIKERLDFSCAIFSPQGELVANAPHLPVHLGAMGESVTVVLRMNKDRMSPGDVYALNTPYNGGSHLPDITLVTPVFDDEGRELLFFVGSRAHHADVGGRTPGSAPPDSRHIDEEGVLIDNFLIARSGRFLEKETRELLTGGKYPCRNPDQNVADIVAQIAANETGVQEVRKMIAQFGLDVVQAYMGHVQANAEESVRRVIPKLKGGSFDYPLDNGLRIKVRIKFNAERREALIDFTGTSEQDAHNFNAPLAVCKAAVLYVFRTLIADDIPLNEGCMRPLRIIVPEGTMLRPKYPAAVISGNTEVSQCITDALFGALGVLASSQGTMNNYVYGNEDYQNYETICGGSGAGADFDGTDAVHTHMTNTRLTDPEVVEMRYPVRVEEFSIRRGSGGAGRRRGGDGVVRRMRFLEEMHVTTLSLHRVTEPYGLEGGLPGKCGRNHVVRADGSVEEKLGTDQADLRPGDVFVVETPGGGGFGTSSS